MSKKYSIPTKTARPRFTPIEKSTILDWEGGCLRCFKCVKRQCIYDVYNQRTFDGKRLYDTIDSLCKNCLRCVQTCPGQIITKVLNPEFKRLGNSYWTPEIISRQWYQAETGKIPVSGAGYGGPFSGPGFDDMWTDMSEIVRPTRDGIHGREYISTVVDLGRKLSFLELDEKNRFVGHSPQNIEIPLPVLFNDLPFGYLSEDVLLAMAEAAQSIDTFLVVPHKRWSPQLESYKKHLIPLFGPEDLHEGINLDGMRILEIYDSKDSDSIVARTKAKNPNLLVAVRVPAGSEARQRAVVLADSGADILHFYADMNGNVQSDDGPIFIKDMIRNVHMGLVNNSSRDKITLIVSGGIAMAEHVAKAIICGADAVAIDLPLLLALECRLCFRCEKDLPCPVEIGNIHPDWGRTRIMNLVAAWRNQLIEVLGAMGIREVRRLRGEVGRAMFFKDLEFDTFGRLFGTRKG